MPTLSSPTTNVTVREGEDIILTCTPSVDTVTLKWLQIPGLGLIDISNNLECVDEYCHTIIISAATTNDEGHYVCYIISENIEDVFEHNYIVKPIIIDLRVLESMKMLLYSEFHQTFRK